MPSWDVDEGVKGPDRIRACPYCGSADIEPLVIFGGPLAAVDNKNETFRCKECGQVAVPLDFESIEAWKDFVRQKRGDPAATAVPEGFLHIPILPVDTSSILSGEGRAAERGRVVSIGWEGKRLVAGEESSRFIDYWRTVGGARYNANDILMMDLSGLRGGEPDFTALKALVKRRYEVWIELGMQDIQDLFDAFALDVKMAVAGTLTAPDMGMFEEAYELSDSCVPLIYFDRRVVWGRGRGPTDLGRAVRAMTDIGFSTVGVMDLSRLGGREGASEDMISLTEGLDAEIILGGGVVESDLAPLEERGFKGAFIDPFSPVISTILEAERPEPVVDPVPLAERSGGLPTAVDG